MKRSAQLVGWVFVALVGVTRSASAAEAVSGTEERSLNPRQFFVQLGAAEHVETAVFGANWSWDWHRSLWGGSLGGYWEISFGRWRSEMPDSSHSSAWVTQIGLTPVLRWQPDLGDGRWFFELGIGANVLLPIYRSRDRSFSTEFNFGDHLAVGRRFGGGDELSLRVQHFSNAGIKHPNPGENFLQLRWARSF